MRESPPWFRDYKQDKFHIAKNGHRALRQEVDSILCHLLYMSFLPLIKPQLLISELVKCDRKCKFFGFCSKVAKASIFWDMTKHTLEISFRCFERELWSHLQASKCPGKIRHFNPWIWDHFVVSICQEPSSQWHGVISQHGSPSNTLTFCKSE